VRPEIVTKALGLADRDAFGKLAEAVVNGDAPAALGLVAELASRGADLRRFVAEAVEFFRGVFLAQYAPNVEEVVDEPADVIAEWRRFASQLPAADVLRVVDALGDALLQLRQGREERLVIELALLRLARPETAPDAASLAARLDRVESRLRAASQQTAASPPTAEPAPIVRTTEPAAPASDPVDAEPTQQPPRPTQHDAMTDAAPASTPSAPPPAALTTLQLGEFETVWPALVARVRDAAGPVRHALVKVASPVAVEDGVVTLEIPAHMPFHLERLQEDHDLRAQMESIAADLLGGAVQLAFASGPDAVPGVPGEPPRAPDKDELLTEGDDIPDPTDMVVDLLGGEIVSE
jgi:DNA polymerase-3 subunit gamma/tau